MDFSNNRKDRRITKTQKSIKRALIELIEEKDVFQITVKELSEKADINRKTFYSHYRNIDDIFNAIDQDIALKIMRIIEKYKVARIDEISFFIRLNAMINENIDFYRKLINASYYSFRFNATKKLLKTVFVEMFHKKSKVDKDELNLCAEYCSSGIISIYLEWFHTNSKLSLNDLAILANKIVTNGINSIENLASKSIT